MEAEKLAGAEYESTPLLEFRVVLTSLIDALGLSARKADRGADLFWKQPRDRKAENRNPARMSSWLWQAGSCRGGVRFGGPGGGGFPAAGQQLPDRVVLQRGQSAQHVGQVCLRIDPIASATLNEGVDDRATPAGVGVANEQPAAPAHRRGPRVIFDQIVVDFESAVGQIAHPGSVFFKETVHRFAEGALGQETGLGALHPVPHRQTRG